MPAQRKLARLGRAMSPRRLGQHFLADPSWRARILATLPAGADDVWVEIGAGHGEMTRELARRAGRVIAVEVDPPLVDALRRLAREIPAIEVVAGDVLTLDLASLEGGHRFKVYGNLPYYITSPILRHLFESADRIETIYIVIQLEVAARLVARPRSRDFGYLSVLTQFYAQPEILFRIPPGAFHPRPKVASALVRLSLPGARATLGISEEQRFLGFVQACFAQKRKTLLNNLRGPLTAARAEGLLEAAGLRRDARAEQLTLAQFAFLFSEVSRR